MKTTHFRQKGVVAKIVDAFDKDKDGKMEWRDCEYEVLNDYEIRFKNDRDAEEILGIVKEAGYSGYFVRDNSDGDTRLKRYPIEFANDVLRHASVNQRIRIQVAIEHYKNASLSSLETVNIICEILKGEE